MSSSASTKTANAKKAPVKTAAKKTEVPAAEQPKIEETKPKTTKKQAEKPEKNEEHMTEEPKKAPARPRAKKTETPAAETTEEQQHAGASSAENTENSSETERQEMPVEKMIDAMMERKKSESKSLKDDLKMLKDLKTAWSKQVRLLKTRKNPRKNAAGGAPRKPSGFAQPTRIRDQLSDFLGLERGTEIARTEVTRQVIKYVRDKHLEQEKNKRFIVLDAALESLLGGAEERLRTMQDRKNYLEDMAVRYPNVMDKNGNPKWRTKADKCIVTDEVSYFNLQVHLNKHFYPAESKRNASSSSAEATAPVATA